MSSATPACHSEQDLSPITCDLDRAEAITGRSKSRIRKAIKNGELLARRDGRRLIVEPGELRRWVRSLPLALSK
jgi:hypothetical protein